MAAARGKICIDRKAYTRRAFTCADGVRVPATHVARSRFCVNDPGTPGRRARGSEAGPFRNQPAWIQRSGDLGGPGFSEKSERERHALLRASVDRFGYRSTLGKLGAILRNTQVHPNVRRVLESDRRWLTSTFGGPGSFGASSARRSANRQNDLDSFVPRTSPGQDRFEAAVRTVFGSRGHTGDFYALEQIIDGHGWYVNPNNATTQDLIDRGYAETERRPGGSRTVVPTARGVKAYGRVQKLLLGRGR